MRAGMLLLLSFLTVSAPGCVTVRPAAIVTGKSAPVPEVNPIQPVDFQWPTLLPEQKPEPEAQPEAKPPEKSEWDEAAREEEAKKDRPREAIFLWAIGREPEDDEEEDDEEEPITTD